MPRPIACHFLSCLITTATLATVHAADPVDFGRDIRPILSDKCFLCHGPATETRQADLRLDQRADAIELGAFVPGAPDDSELLARITSDDPDEMMPPPGTGKSITAEEAETLRQWIEQGAAYSEHWAFIPPVRPPLAELSASPWERNPIDRFVSVQLRRQQLSPSPPADRTTLIRRLYLDLIGLPPSPQEIDECLSDADGEGIANLIDRLIDSQHFGEKWGKWWLDAARYADSDGYEKDKPRSVWFYRDWVVDAMNSNMPYDQFVIQQIAGDLLADAGQDEHVATGFLRNSMVNEEGGADPEQFRVEGMFDRMDAIGKAILGVTTQCAQCHTHKYDPLSHREYYQMMAALNDFEEATISVFTAEQAQARDRALHRIDQLERSVKTRAPDWQERLAEWESRTQSQLIRWHGLTPTDIPYEGQKFRVLDDGSILSESYAPTRTTNTFSLRIQSPKITAFRLDALLHPQLPRGGPGRSIYGTGAVTEFKVTLAPADNPQQKRDIKFSAAYSDANPPHSTLPAAFRDKVPADDDRVTGPVEYAIDGNGKTAWSTDVGPGRRNEPRHAIFVPAEPIEESGDYLLSFTLSQNHGGWNSDDNQNYLLGRYRFSITDQPVSEVVIPSAIEEILWLPRSRRTAQDQSRLFGYWLTTESQFADTAAEIETAWQSYPETDSQLVVQALPHARETYVFTRGDFLNPSERVTPAAPKFLGPFPDTGEPARLRLARWLVRDDAPTTARVIVNRIWQSYFGRGLVASPEDFGYQGAPPSHPQLLDWLAVELMESGWNLKHIHRLIVDSATYRQSSSLTPELLDRDPQNVWLARGPRFRVDAELVRDIALAASGLLDPAIGGPSVYPPAPEFLFQPPASYGPKVWKTATDTQQFRRSLYIHSYRSVPYPALQVFDAPKGDAACIRRERSNTPLQALVTLNEPQYVACAQAMAARIVHDSGPDDEDRIRYGHRLVVGRSPSASETQILRRLLEQQRDRIDRGELDVQNILGASGVTVRRLAGISPDELAPWVVVSRALLNLDETITKP
jgi:hypothetical protein